MKVRLYRILSKTFVKKILLFILLFCILLMLPWGIISLSIQDRVYRDLDTIPEREVGLLLGTTPSIDGINNVFYSTRIEAAKMLYERGKVHHILVS